MITGIIVALPEELSTLTKQKIPRGDCAFIAENILVACSGSGPGNAKKAAKLLLGRGSRQLISWGCAAALDTSLKPGDLSLPETLIAENQRHYPAHSDWHHQVAEVLSDYCHIFFAPLCESSKIISSREDKITLNKQNSSISLDMENVAIAKISDQASIPFLTIRATKIGKPE